MLIVEQKEKKIKETNTIKLPNCETTQLYNYKRN